MRSSPAPTADVGDPPRWRRPLVVAAKVLTVVALLAGIAFNLIGLPPLREWGEIYRLDLDVYRIGGRALLAFEPLPACGQPVDGLVLSRTRTIVPSGTRGSCYQEPKPALTSGNHRRIRALNLESNQESNLEERARDVENLIRGAARSLSVAAKKSFPTAQSGPRRNSGDILPAQADDPEAPRLPLDPPGERR